MRLFELIEDEKLGFSLADSGFGRDYVTIFQAVDSRVNIFKRNDHVTLSKKIAIEQGQKMLVGGLSIHIMKKIVKASEIHQLLTVDEYLYSGDMVRGEVIYTIS